MPRPLLETTTYSDGISFPKFQPKRSGSASSSRSQNRAVVRVVGPPRRGSPTGTRKSPIKEVKTLPAADAVDNDSTDSEDSKYNAHQVGAAKRQPFPKRLKQKFTVFGQRLSSDLCGPFPESVEGYTYMLNIVDAATNIMEVYYLKSKSSAEVKAAFENFLIKYKIKFEACRAAGHDVNWRTDNGGEFMSADLDAFLHEFSVVRSFSTPYAPPQNAHAERMWGIILRCMRTTMAESGISERFWTFAAANAVMLHNSLPSTKLPDSVSPSEALTGKKPDLSRFRVFGCIAWYFLPEHERSSNAAVKKCEPPIDLGVVCALAGRNLAHYERRHLNNESAQYQVHVQRTLYIPPPLDREKNHDNHEWIRAVLHHARDLGMDVQHHYMDLDIVAESLEAELPLGWEAYVVPQGQEFGGLTYVHYYL